MPLHIDYRPQDFDEVVGNKTTIENIKNKIYGNDPPHAILLHGPFGCGKTSIGYLISEALGCSIKSNDFVELDAVQTGTIESAREIRQNMSFLPFDERSKCRVWLIDEIHASSAKFQEGLLKALEKSPPHAFFILCTTDLNKVNGGIKQRCTHFKVGKLNSEQITKLLKWILLEEKKTDINQDVIDEIIKAAEGSPREAVKILDQIFDLDPDKMIDAIQGTEAEREVRELCQAMLKGASWPELAEIIKGMKDIDAERARQAIIAWFASVALDKKGFNKKNKKKWDEVAAKSALVFDCFRENYYSTGMSGLVFSCYNTTL